MTVMNISSSVVDAILEFLPKGKTILELGTGEGTKLLAEHWKVISVENNPAWHLGVSELLHVPLWGIENTVPRDNVEFWEKFPEASRWYNPVILKEKLTGVKYDVILIDGPMGGPRRVGMWWHYASLFDTSVPVIVDDVHREYDWLVAAKIAEIKGVKDFKVVQGEGHKMTAVIR